MVFEVCRLLHKRFAPSGGRHELSRITNILTREQCSNLSQLPRAVDDLESDFRKYNARTGHTFPLEWRLPLLLQTLPQSHKDELELKYCMGNRDYETMSSDVVAFAKDRRFAQAEKRDPNAMMVDNLEKMAREAEEARTQWDEDDEHYTPEEWDAYREDIRSRVDESLSYMGSRKGAGKGKGERKGKGKGDNRSSSPRGDRPRNPATAPPMQGQRDTRICHWCDKPGHVIKDCRAKAAGKPQLDKYKKRQPARSLEQGDWEEEDGLREPQESTKD